MLAPEPCRSARRPSKKDSTGPSFGLTAPARSHRSDAFPQRTSPSDSPLRCKLSRSGRFSPLPSAPSPEVSLQNPERALPKQAKPRNSERLAGRSTPLPQSSQLATARLLVPWTGKGKDLGRGARRGPAGDGVLRAPRRQPQWCRPAGADYNSQRALRQPTRLPPQSPIPPPPPPPPHQLRLLLGLQLQKEGRPVWKNRSPQPREVRAGVCCLSETLKASKWKEAISCSRYHP